MEIENNLQIEKEKKINKKLRIFLGISLLSIVGLFIFLLINGNIYYVSGTSEEKLIEPNQIMQNFIIDGDRVYFNDSNIYVSATPNDLSKSGFVTFNLTLKTYSGDADMAIGVDTEIFRPKRIELKNLREINVSKNYTCRDFFNYTLNPNRFWCYENVSIYDEQNLTQISSELRLIFNHSFDTGNLATKTAFWNEQIIQEWQDFSSGIFSTDFNYQGTNKWWLKQNVPVIANREYIFRIYFEVIPSLGNKEGKYWFALKPSSQNLQNAIGNNTLYALDPFFNSTYSYKRNVTGLNNTIPFPVNSSGLVNNFLNITGTNVTLYGSAGIAPAIYFSNSSLIPIANDTEQFWSVIGFPVENVTGITPNGLNLFVPMDIKNLTKNVTDFANVYDDLQIFGNNTSPTFYNFTNSSHWFGGYNFPEGGAVGVGYLNMTGATTPLTNSNGTFMMVFESSKSCGTGGINQWLIFSDRTSSTRFFISTNLNLEIGGFNVIDQPCTTFWSANKVHQMVVTWDTVADVYAVYIDKTQVNRSTLTATIGSIDGLLLFGDTIRARNGVINVSHVEFFNYTFSSAQINSTYDITTTLGNIEYINPKIHWNWSSLTVNSNAPNEICYTFLTGEYCFTQNGRILFTGNATISRTGVNTSIWISESGNVITKYG